MKTTIIYVLLIGLMTALPGTGFGKDKGKAADALPSIAEDIRMGESRARMLIRWESTDDKPGTQQTEMLSRLQVIVKRLGAVSDIPSLPYDVRLVTSKMANAVCLPGGKIIVFSGIWDKKKGFVNQSSDEEIAAVLAHEIAHAALRHWARKQFAGETKREAEYETEADLRGMTYLARAGYNPTAMVRIFGRDAAQHHHDGLGNAQVDNLTQEWERVFASHPNSKVRTQTLRAHLSEALDIYNTTQSKNS